MHVINLAAAAHEKGLKCLIVDKDQQQSCYDMSKSGKLPFAVSNDMPEKKPNVDLVLVDYPAQHFKDLYYGEQYVVTPVLPCKVDFKAFFKSLEVLKEKKLVKVVNRVDMRIRDEKSLSEELAKQGAFTVRSRSIYGRANSEDTSIFDERWNNASGAREARNEMRSILDHLWEL